MANQYRSAPRILRLAMCALILSGWGFAQNKIENKTPVSIEHFLQHNGQGDITLQKLERGTPDSRFTVPFVRGNVFAAVANGSVQHYDNNGNLLETLDSGLGGFTTGMASDADGNLYMTNFTGGFISRFTGPADPHTHSVFATADLASSVESILFDQNGDTYVGQAAGTSDIIKYNDAGTEIARYDVSVGPRGSDWIDLSADQTTMFYTSEGSDILRYDVVNNVQLTPFVSSLPGTAAYALRLLPGGGILVADSERIHRLDSNGTIAQSYDATGQDNWFALNLDPDGTSFWSGDFNTSNFYRFDIASGDILAGPINTGTGTFTLFGLSVFGEITVSTNNPPVCEITPAGPFTVQEGDLLTFDITAFDPNINDPITIEVVNLPANATMTPSLPLTGPSGVSSTFEWIPQYGQSGSFEVSFTVTDSSGAADTCDVSIFVEELERSPHCSIDPMGPYVVDEGQLVEFTVTALDSNLNDQVTLSVFNSLPSGAGMTPTLPITGAPGISSDFSWTPASGQAGTYRVTFSVEDNSAGGGGGFRAAAGSFDSCSVTIIVNEPNVDPSCDISPPGPFVLTTGETVGFTVTATDPNTGETVTIDSGNLPTGSTMNPALPASGSSGTSSDFSWTPAVGQEGSYTVSYTISDAAGATSTCDVSITVLEANIDPTCGISPSGPFTVTVGNALSFTVTGTDANSSDLITIISSTLPTGSAMNPALPLTGPSGISSDFNWAPVEGQEGNYSITYTITDTSGASCSSIVDILVEAAPPVNEPPVCVFSSTGPFTVTVGNALNFTVAGTDVNNGDLITITSSTLPTGSAMNPALPLTGPSGISSDFSWTPTTGQEGNYSITYTITDTSGASCGNTVEILVEAAPPINVPPVCNLDPSGPFTITVGNALNFTVTGTDANAGDLITINSSTLPSGSTMDPALPVTGPSGISSIFDWIPTAGQEGTYTITYTTTDSSGASCSTVVDILVEAAPPINVPPVCNLDPSGPFTITVGNALNFTVTGTDANAGDLITINSSTLPSGSTMDPALPVTGPSGISSLFDWTPTAGQEGNYTITYTTTDSSGASCSTVVDIVVEAAPPVNEAPFCSLDPAGPFIVNVGDAVDFVVTGIDPNSGDIVTIDGSNLPTGSVMNPALPVSGADTVSSAFNWTPVAGQEGDYTITYIISDNNGASDTCDVAITVNTIGTAGDSIAPFCQITANDPGPPETIEVTVQDFESGIAEVNILNTTNASIAIPAFSPGTNDALIIIATKLDPNESATVVLQVIDVEGNITVCDPVYQTVSAVIPEGFVLEQNFPNPFNPNTLIRFDVPATSLGAQTVSLRVYDISGREIRTLINEAVQPGQHQVEWDGLSNNGSHVAGGIYFYRLVSGDYVATRKMVYMK
ncbi:MAG: Ig-like domain-containing protein [Calditrichia bacterium]